MAKIGVGKQEPGFSIKINFEEFEIGHPSVAVANSVGYLACLGMTVPLAVEPAKSGGTRHPKTAATAVLSRLNL